MTIPELQLETPPLAFETQGTPDLQLVENRELVVTQTTKYRQFIAESYTAYDDFLQTAEEDPAAHAGIIAYKEFISILAADTAPHNDPVNLAELCTGCTDQEALTEGLIQEFLNGLPGLHKIDLDPENNTGMLTTAYMIKPNDPGSPHNLLRIFRTEHDFTGERRVYYSVTHGKTSR